MPAHSAIRARVAPVAPPRPAGTTRQKVARVRFPRLAAWRRKTRGEGTIALAELGRETGARC